MNVQLVEPVDEQPTGLGDADLVTQVREGSADSYAEPYAELYRRHQPAALALARTLTEHTSADDIVSEAFEKLLQRIRGGGGPEAAFRPYLLRTVRTVAVDASRRTRRLVVAEDPVDAARTATTDDDALVDAVHERTTLARAFAALPERWQSFLWLSFVDDADRQEIATILGISVGSVSALGYRAREGLRRAYLDAHLRTAPTPECADVWPMLAGAIRGALSPAQQVEVDRHVDECGHCRAALAELEAVNTRFGAVLAPIVLGAAAPAYLAAVHGGGATAVTAGAVASGGAAVGAEAGTTATGVKAVLAGLGLTSAAGIAVVACLSTVALVSLLAVFTAPLASEPTLSAPLGIATTSDDAARSATEGGEETADGTGPTVTGAVATSPGEPTSTITDGTPTTDPSATPTGGGPTVTSSGSPTAGPTGNPTSAPTSTGTTPATPQPTSKPTPTPAGTQPPAPTVGTSSPSPTDGPSQQATPSSSPTPTSTPGPAKVDAGLTSVVVQPTGQVSYPVHLAIPVSLSGGTADLQVTLTIVGLNKFATTSGAGEGGWSCAAITPMGGAGKSAVVRCSLPNASPGDPLTVGLDIGYAGSGSVEAQLAVLAPADDSSAGDNTASATLPPRN
jgi:RNA polymerase sigma factor (sigma-70 family)